MGKQINVFADDATYDYVEKWRAATGATRSAASLVLLSEAIAARRAKANAYRPLVPRHEGAPMKQASLLDTSRTHKHPRRRILRALGEVEKASGVRAFAYELECGHRFVRNGAAPSAKSVDCKLCPTQPRARR